MDDLAGKTVGGKPVTEQQVQAWADEAEQGYEVAALRRRGRPALGTGPSDVVPVRIDKDLLAALERKAGQDGLSRSEAIREAIRAWSEVA